MDVFEKGQFNKDNNEFYDFLGLALTSTAVGIGAGINAIKKKKQAKHYQQKATEYAAMFPAPTNSTQATQSVEAIKKTRSQKEIDQLNSKAKSTKKDLQDEIDILKDMEKVFTKAAADFKYEEEKKAAVIPTTTAPVEKQLESTIDKATGGSVQGGERLVEQGSIETQDPVPSVAAPKTNKYLTWVGVGVFIGVFVYLMKKK